MAFKIDTQKEETVTRVMPHNSDSMLTNKWHHINKELWDKTKKIKSEIPQRLCHKLFDVVARIIHRSEIIN